MVIDGHSLAFRAFYALPVDSFKTADGQHTNAIHGFISLDDALLRARDKDFVIAGYERKMREREARKR